MNPNSTELLATVLFGLAVLHTLCVKRFARWAHEFPPGSVRENLLHFLAETEVVFGLAVERDAGGRIPTWPTAVAIVFFGLLF